MALSASSTQTSTQYEKGPRVLNKLKQRKGKELYQKFLSSPIAGNLKSTKDLLNLLEEITSKKIVRDRVY